MINIARKKKSVSKLRIILNNIFHFILISDTKLKIIRTRTRRNLFKKSISKVSLALNSVLKFAYLSDTKLRLLRGGIKRVRNAVGHSSARCTFIKQGIHKMAIIIKDRVKETTTTTGTGAVTLAGAMTGFRAFSSVMANNDTCYYCIQGVDISGNPSGEWETGLGTYNSSGTTLTRTTVHASSNSGSAVSFSAGTKQVILDATARNIKTIENSTSLSKYNPNGDGSTDDYAVFTSLTDKDAYIPSPSVDYKLSAEWKPAATDRTINAAPDVKFSGGFFPDFENLIPYESSPGPIWAQSIISKTYGSEWSGCGNVFQNASYAKANVTGVPVVAQYGQGEAALSGTNAWGSNFTGSVSASGGTAITCEMNPITLASGGTCYGNVIASSGVAQIENAEQLDSNDSTSQFKDGWYAHFATTRGCITNAIWRASGNGSSNSCQRFMYVSGVTATSAEIDIPSFTVAATVASTVNRPGVSGSATGNPVQLYAEGTDSAISIKYNSKASDHKFQVDGADHFQVLYRASAVNYSTTKPGASGGGVTWGVTGSNSTIPISITSKADIVTIGSSGGEILRCNTTASAVNYIGAKGAATGGSVVLSSNGSDSTVPFTYNTKGDIHTFQSSGVEMMRINSTSSAVNYATVTAATTGNGVTFGVAGTDSNIDHILGIKGTGVIKFGNTSTAASVAASFSAARYLPVKDGSGTTYYIPLATSTW